MATETDDPTNAKGLLLPPHALPKFIEFAQGVLTKHNQFRDLRNKFDAIDVAYARYKAACSKEGGSESGIDVVNPSDANYGCDIFAEDNVVPPIVVSQVDSYVAYLADVFLTGSPLFPVVSPPSKRAQAEQLEAVMDDHANLGGYARQLLMLLRDGAKYNFGALEVDWDSISQFSVLNSFYTDGQKIENKPKKFTKLKRLNPRNTVWDWSLSPGDVAEHGDYAGFIEKLSRTKFQRLVQKWRANKEYTYNIEKAFASGSSTLVAASATFTEDPVISDYGQLSLEKNAEAQWDAWFDPSQKKKTVGGKPGDNYEIFTLYARILPSDFGLGTGFAPKTPQIWKMVFCNNQFLIHAKRIISAYDYLPILFIQPLEDGLKYQTQSVAEGEIPFQKAAATLFNIRFAASRRAVSDRAIYDPEVIAPTDVNSPVPAPKIPARLSVLSNKKITDAYFPIPFDMRGTETTLQDANMIVQFSKDLHGVNGPRQGSFQKGNKSVREWDDTMGGSESRMRLPALTIEHQIFSPLRSIISLNILQYGEDGVVVSQSSGKELEVKIAELRAAHLTFKVADGFTPKAKLASTEAIATGMQMISNNPILQQQLAPTVVPMFLHLMTLMGIKGMNEYNPADPANQQAMNTGLPGNNLQQPGAGGPNPPTQTPLPQGMPPGMPQGIPQGMPAGPIA